MPDPYFRPDQMRADTQLPPVGPEQATPEAKIWPIPILGTPPGQTTPSAIDHPVPNCASRSGPTNHAANDVSRPKGRPSHGTAPAPDHAQADTHTGYVGGGPLLYDPGLYLLAEQLNAIEDLRKATSNRLGHATRDTEDSDGEVRGLGLPEDHPAVAQTGKMLEGLEAIEKAVIRDLERAMKAHPLGGWQRETLGVGAKQLARLLACIGDPYWNTLHNRPRTVSELWAYCGLHTLPADQTMIETQPPGADGASLPAGQVMTDAHSTLAGRGQLAARHPDHPAPDTQPMPVWVAARRRKGQRANWSAEAKSRLRMIAESMLKAGNRGRYDKRRAETGERTHVAPCAQCGAKGRPAAAGTPWKLGHQHSDALRMVAKYEVLLPLWRAARDFHNQSAGGRR